MKKIYENIDQLYKDNFSEHTIAPKSNHWDEIYKKTIRKNFFSTDFTRFNMVYSFMILSTFVLSVLAFVNSQNTNLNPEPKLQDVRLNDTVKIETLYIYDTIIEYVKINSVPQNTNVDTVAIIKSYLREQQLQEEQIQIELPKQDSITMEKKDSATNFQIIYHTIEKKDTFVKYMEKEDKESSSNSIFKRNKK